MRPPNLIYPAIVPATNLLGGAVPGGSVYTIDPEVWAKIFGPGVPEPPSLLPPAPAPVLAPTPPVAPPRPDSAAIVAALNAARSKAHLPPWSHDPRLATLAAYWSGWQAHYGVMTHDLHPGDFAARMKTIYPGLAAAECVAEGYPDVAAVVAAWMNSETHRAVVLGDYTRAGAGLATAADGTIYWTLDCVKT